MSKISMTASSGLINTLFWISGGCFLIVSHMAKGKRELSGVSFVRALSPFMRASLS